MTKKERPDVLKGKTRRIKTGCGNLYVTVNFNENTPVEVFCRLGKAGGCAACQMETVGRLLTLYLSVGSELTDAIISMRGISCHSPVFIGDGAKTLSCIDAIAQALEKMIGEEKK